MKAFGHLSESHLSVCTAQARASDLRSQGRLIAPSDVTKSVREVEYPGIAHAVTLLWGYPEMNAYFSKLWLADERLMPISIEAMSELMLLARVYEHLSAPADTDKNHEVRQTPPMRLTVRKFA